MYECDIAPAAGGEGLALLSSDEPRLLADAELAERAGPVLVAPVRGEQRATLDLILKPSWQLQGHSSPPPKGEHDCPLSGRISPMNRRLMKRRVLVHTARRRALLFVF